MDDALKHAFTDACLRYETAFTQFTTANSAGAGEVEQQSRYREFADAQHAFLQSAHRLARSLLEQAEEQEDPPQDTTHTPELDGRSDWMRPPDEPTDAPEPEPALEPRKPQEQEIRGRPARRGFFRFGRPA